MKKNITKILHILPKYKIGGVESTIFNSFQSINKVYDYHLLSIEPTDDKLPDSAVVEPQKLNTLNGKFWNIITALKLIINIFKIKPDIIIVSLWKSALLCLLFYPILKLKKIKLIHFIHSAYYANPLDKIITPIFSKLADYIYCDSYSSKEFIETKTKKKAEVISFLVDKRTSISNNEKDFVYIARLNKTKNILGALDIFERISKHYPNSIFDIYGPDEGELKKLLENIKAKKLDSVVRYLGTIENSKVEETLKNYAFYLQPSYKEGMAISVIDAMQLGVVPCVFPVGEIRFYSKHLDNIIFLDKDNITNSANIILDVMNNPYLHKNIKQNAITTFQNKLTYSESFLMHLRKISQI
ncbi:glycosyltransferase family 4 protein [Providencia vermicola]|uniref:glycosyltransferase family 4 protein n=1 Tax=Providencia TaxID=586 RepID=UPI00234BE724|nr:MULTISPECIES: glycosyltransferase family 4 protein [unclassified Providencia]